MDKITNQIQKHEDLTIKLLKQYKTVQKPEFMNSPLAIQTVFGENKAEEGVFLIHFYLVFNL